jgi:DNA-binding NtrC family response regulator
MSERATILVVEDDPGQREQLVGFLRGLASEVLMAGDAETAQAILREQTVDVVVTDLQLPGESGIDLLRTSREQNPLLDFVVITAHGTVETAVEAMRLGAYDFLTKPLDLDLLEFRIRRVIEKRKLDREVRILRERLRERIDIAGFVAESGAMQEVLRMVRRVAPTSTTVLLMGESGTGKERVAEALHAQSPRRDGPYIRVNCAALPENLLETELFGHMKGAFTGAHADHIGRFEEADGGTILLDEIGEISQAVQVKLLRVLQEKEIVRVGDNRARPVDVRVIAATNRDLEQDVKDGRFREDLYYRIQVIAIRIPPLRERREDVAALVPLLLDRFAKETGVGRRTISREAHDLLLAYPFPGNVRELMNILERAVILSTDEQIVGADLPDRVSLPPEPESVVENLNGRNLPELIEEIERRAIRRALADTGGVKARAARTLGLPERVLRYKLKKYDIEPTKLSES